MENQLQSKPSLLGSFTKGFLNGAGTGGLMMGIFQLVALTGLLHGIAIPYMIGMVVCTGLFSGVMAVKRDLDENKEIALAARSGVTPRGRSPEAVVPVPVVGAAVAADRAPEQAQWAERVGGAASRDRVSQILANGSLSDKDRAAAILAERNAAQLAEAQR